MADSLEIYAFHDGTGIDHRDHSTPIAMCEYERSRTHDEALANARLIAAAPALLSALEEAQSWFDELEFPVLPCRECGQAKPLSPSGRCQPCASEMIAAALARTA